MYVCNKWDCFVLWAQGLEKNTTATTTTNIVQYLFEPESQAVPNVDCRKSEQTDK